MKKLWPFFIVFSKRLIFFVLLKIVEGLWRVGRVGRVWLGRGFL